jgi:glucose-6-phosphate isomerase
MFRNIARPGTKGTFNSHNVRVDITAIPARQLGVEPVRTLGHFHPISEIGKPFPEIYQVLWGKALFLEFAPKIKDDQQDFNRIEKVNVWEAKTDNFVVISGGGHITINPSKSRPLIILNLVYSRFNSIYDPLLQMKGAPYFFVNIDKEMKFMKNKNYKKVAPIKPQELLETYGPLKQGKAIYKSFLDDPKFFNFLAGKPEKKKKPKKGEPKKGEKKKESEPQAQTSEKPSK